MSAVAILAAARPTGGASPAVNDVSVLLRPILSKHPGVPAVFGLLWGDGRVRSLGATGVRKAGSSVPVSSADLIHLGSDTKAMTALLVGQLVQAGQLAWTDRMGAIFPELRPSMAPGLADVTVVQLLQHTAGLAPNLDWRALARTGKPVAEQRQMAVRQALTVPPLSPPGTRFLYSNTDYVLLGAIIERKTGRPWEGVITDRVFRPLGMTSAGFGPPGAADSTDQPWGHVTANGRVTPVWSDNPPVMAPAGEVHCDMADWAKFVGLYCRPPGEGGPSLLGPPMLAQLTTPAAGGRYAGGWIVVDRGSRGGRALSHDGSNTMWYCRAWVFPRDGYAVLAAANSGTPDAAAACGDVCDALIQQRKADAGQR